MSTIAAGQIARMTRPAALEFSFLVSIPTMFAATLYDLVKASGPASISCTGIKPAVAAGSHSALAPVAMTRHGWIVLLVGFRVSFFVALGVVEWFLQWVRRHGFVLFALYRLLLGAALFIFGGHLMSAVEPLREATPRCLETPTVALRRETRVPANEDSASGFATCPRNGSGELERVGRAQRESIQKSLRLGSECVVWSHFLPTGQQSIQACVRQRPHSPIWLT